MSEGSRGHAGDGHTTRSGTDGGDAPRSGTAPRSRAVLVVLVLALAALASGVPVWLRTAGTTALAGEVAVTATGTQAAPGVPAAALVLLAAGFAAGLAGPVGRWAVVAVVLLAGLLLTASALGVATDPDPVARTVVAGATGVDTLAAPVALTPWPWVAVATGVLVLVAGGWLAATSRRWARPSDRHDRDMTAPSAVVPDDDRAAWDALSRGDDPS